MGLYVPDILRGENRDGCFSSNPPHSFVSNSEAHVEPFGCVTQELRSRKKNWMCESATIRKHWRFASV